MNLNSVGALEAATVPSLPATDLSSNVFQRYRDSLAPPGRLAVVGHRGSGKNKSKRIPWLGGLDPPPPIRENTIVSFVTAAQQGADFIEFDVQVTKDGHPIIFHDDYIYTSDGRSCRLGDLTLEEFRSIGPQKGGSWGGIAVSDPAPGRELLREIADGSIERWDCTIEDSLCTLQEAFREVPEQIGFDVEIKFLDTETDLNEIQRVVTAVIPMVLTNSQSRRIVFSTFHPDAAVMLRQRQSTCPVFFLTDGGLHRYADPRRNSLPEAINLCLNNKLHGIVTEVTAVLREPSYIGAIKQANLQLLTYGEANNLPETAYFQHFHGVDGVIVDHVRQIATAARSRPTVNISQPANPLTALQGEPLKSPIAVRAV